MQDRSQISTTPPLPGPDLVAGINAALGTIATDFAGGNDPANIAGPYMTWADTANGLIKRRNATNTAWVTVGELYQPSQPIFSAALIPTSDRGPITVVGIGPMEWDNSLNMYIPIRIKNFRTIATNTSVLIPSTRIFVQGCGGGGGGGGGAGFVGLQAQLHGGGGGAGQSTLWVPVATTPQEVLDVQIGAGGSAGSGGAVGGAGGAGGNGGPTRLMRGATALVNLDFGRGGGGALAGGPAPGGVGYPAGQWGQGCQEVSTSSSLWLSAGSGASSLFGIGALGPTALSEGANGTAGTGYGSGGSGGCSPVSNSGAAGGAGGQGRPGVLMIAW